jgi:hypothetical protein
MRLQFSAIVLPLAALAAPVHAAPETVTPAQAACDEQAGEFHRESGVAYCLVDGIVFSFAEPAASVPKPCVHRSPPVTTLGQGPKLAIGATGMRTPVRC